MVYLRRVLGVTLLHKVHMFEIRKAWDAKPLLRIERSQKFYAITRGENESYCCTQCCQLDVHQI